MQETKSYPTLYARNSKGQIKWWRCSLIDNETNADICIEYGVLNGNNQTRLDNIKEGKNLNKANATTYYTQAESEIDSRYELQRKLGYKSASEYALTDENTLVDLETSIPLINFDNNKNIIPMRCSGYYIDKKTKKKLRIKFPCLAQPKINGFRCVISYEDGRVIVRGKKGIEITILEHIISEFKPEMFDYNGIDIIFDGELYTTNTILSDISSAVKTRQLLTQAIKFYCFDLAIPNLNNKERDKIRYNQIYSCSNNNVLNVESIYVNNDKEAQVTTDSWIKAGFEGAIFRDPEAVYGFGRRPTTIVKLKRSMDSEFKIVDIVSENNDDYTVLICKNDITSDTFKCSIEGSFEYRRELLSNKSKYIGKEATCKYFERTVNNLPFHAICTNIE